MSLVEQSYPLNTAQLRNLRHWSAADQLSMTSAILIQPPAGISASDAIAAVRALLGRHEALRARLARDRGADPVQEVLTPAGAAAALAVTQIELPAGSRPDAGPEQVAAAELAVRCVLFLRAGSVRAVKLSVSHVFTDAFGVQALTRDLTAILRHDQVEPALPRQAAQYARGPLDPVIRANTARWRDLLADAPRSCTYSAAPRAPREPARDVWVPLAADPVGAASRQLRATPYVIWAAIISSFVQLVSGQHRQVFRSTYANRMAPADAHAVAQLAQAVYLPVAGQPGDTFRDRVAQLSRITFATLRWGHYDALGLLDWLNAPASARGAIFQPAFELNYIPIPRDGKGTAKLAGLDIQETQVRIDPPSAKADFVVTVIHNPDPAVRFSVRRPVARQRAAEQVAADCLTVMRALCASPDQVIADVPVRPFTEELLHGHHSGVAVAPLATCELVKSFPGVESCSVKLCRDGTLLAHVSASQPIATAALRDALRRRQPWLAGSVVPDRFDIAN